MSTNIEWTDRVWNPVTGCTKVSAGCKHCYAETIANRRLPHGGFTDRTFTEVRCHPERLDAPMNWRKPCRVFVNSMSDLFHEQVPYEFIVSVFATMYAARRHTYQILTKRPERMLAFTEWCEGFASWPYIWLGTSAENQPAFDARVDSLRATPAAVRFLSLEPLLGPIDMNRNLSGIGWVIVGGESGPKARPCDIAWIRDIVRQCRAAGKKCFVKQCGSRPVGNINATDETPPIMIHLRDRKGGDPSEWPADIRIREFPR